MTELRADGVSAGYPGRTVLQDVDLTVRTGELLALIGPNGAGKTTLLRLLARQLRPIVGAVALDGISLWEQSSRWVARRIAITRSDRVTERPVTVQEAVSLGRAPHRGWLLPLREEDRDAVRNALDRVGLEKHAERPVTELSAGEKQRVTLARALAQEPRVLLVDEPTTHLDLRYQAEILDRLQELARGGMVVVAALHDLNLAALWADRIAIVANGTVSAVGVPEEILTADRLEAAYETPVSVSRHPDLGTLCVTPVPAGTRRGR